MTFSNIQVTAICAALPHARLDLLTLSSVFSEMDIKRIMHSTGISHIAVASASQKSSDFCYIAAKSILHQLNISPKTIDAVVFISQTPDAKLPATSVILQHRLALNSEVLAFDINYGCSGYIYGLLQASILIQSGAAKRVLVCAGDTITHHLNPTDHSVRLVFGDAGSATLIEKGTDELSFAVYTDGSGEHQLKANINGYLHMDGKAVMEFALEKVPPCIDEVLQMKKWEKKEVGAYVLHQANHFMINYLRKKMLLSADAVPITMQKTGNTGPASIPLALAMVRERLQAENRLEKIILCGFGVGFSWGAIGLDLSKTILLPVCEMHHADKENFLTKQEEKICIF